MRRGWPTLGCRLALGGIGRAEFAICKHTSPFGPSVPLLQENEFLRDCRIPSRRSGRAGTGRRRQRTNWHAKIDARWDPPNCGIS